MPEGNVCFTKKITDTYDNIGNCNIHIYAALPDHIALNIRIGAYESNDSGLKKMVSTNQTIEMTLESAKTICATLEEAIRAIEQKKEMTPIAKPEE